MAKGKQFSKKRDQHFQLVFREQGDALIHDENAPQMVLKPTDAGSSSKSSAASSHLDDLASQYDARIRDNEGEAAEYGVYFDDTEYDYMQHLRDLNTGGSNAVWVSAESAATNRGKGKQKPGSLEEALRRLDLDTKDADTREMFGEEMLPSKNLQRYNYQSQQDIPDAIGGFQPDMDPRIREALEALEDDAYVNNEEDDDIFKALTKDGQELDEYEFEETEEDGWETDDTARPSNEFKAPTGLTPTAGEDEAPGLVPVTEDEDPEAADTVDPDWMQNFNKFKKDQKTSKKAYGVAPSAPDLQSSIMTTTTNGGRHKKRKGALTSTSTYSMTSSSLLRTDLQRTLDEKFDKLEEQYDADQDDMASVSQFSAMSTSSVTGPVRSDFDSMLDDFLDGHSMFNKKYMRKGGWKNGADQLDEIRREMGPPRIPKKYGGRGAKLGAK